MTSLIIQTLLLMTIAFILGCFLGGLLRFLFGRRDADADATVRTSTASVGQVGTGAAIGAGAVGLAGVAGATARGNDAAVADSEPVAPAIPAPPRPKVARPAPPAPAAPVVPAEKATIAPRSSLLGTGATDSGSDATSDAGTPRAKTGGKSASRTAPAAATARKRTTVASDTGPAGTSKAGTRSGATAKAKPSAADTAAAAAKVKVTAPAGEPDNLKLIRGIGPQNEGRLNNLGVTTFRQIGGWNRKQQREYGEALAFPGRIEREDWVGQAKVLAKGGKTDFSSRVKSGAVSSSMGSANAGDMGTKPKNTLTEARGGKPDNLTLIDGVGNAIEKKMFRLGIYHFDQVAQMTKKELVWLGNAVGFPGRPERENWKGESKILAAGGTTDHARRVEKGQIKTSRISRKDER